MEALEATLATVIEVMATCEYYSRVYKGVLDNITLRSDATTEDLVRRIKTTLQNLNTAVYDFMKEARKHFESTSEIAYSDVAVLNCLLDYSNHFLNC